MSDSLRVAYLGNFGPEHSTENHVARALRFNGVRVHQLQENDPHAWAFLAEAVQGGHFDLVLWTRTGWDWPNVAGISLEDARDLQWRMLGNAQEFGVPTVGFHLDRWFGLNREPQVVEEPFFRVALLVTADGGHDAEWEAAGVNHHWMPPGVSREECLRVGQVRSDLRAQVGFVGSWRSYHQEWSYRRELVQWLRSTYGRPARPRPHVERLRIVEGGMRGQDLCDLYASIDVLVGDSCLVPGADGTPAARYWSDRIPETLGRGGFLIHPEVPGLREYFPEDVLATYPLGDLNELGARIEMWLARPEDRAARSIVAREHVLEHHTYEVRMAQLVALLAERGMLR